MKFTCSPIGYSKLENSAFANNIMDRISQIKAQSFQYFRNMMFLERIMDEEAVLNLILTSKFKTALNFIEV